MTTRKPPRRAGARRGILVHDWLGQKGIEATGFPYGKAHHVTSDRDPTPSPQPMLQRRSAGDGSRKDAPMISRKEIEDLGRFRAEVARGILHTPEQLERMAELQHRFDVWRPVLTARPRPRRRCRLLPIRRKPR